jgi:hypothetical protein
LREVGKLPAPPNAAAVTKKATQKPKPLAEPAAQTENLAVTVETTATETTAT